MNDASFLGHFWELGSTDPALRRNAAVAVLSSLAATAHSDPAETSENDVYNTEEEPSKKRHSGFRYRLPQGQNASPLFLRSLEYTTNRLIHGLSSARDGVRIGFATTLDVILKTYSAFVPIASIVDAIHKTTALPKGIPGEHGDFFLGRIFGYSAVQRAGYFKSAACLTQIETVVTDLLEALEHKAYLQDAAAETLAAILVDFEVASPGLGLKFIGPRLHAVLDYTKTHAVWDTTKKKHGTATPFGLLYLYLLLYRRTLEHPMKGLSRDPILALPSCLDILLHPATIWTCHPKIPAAWFELFYLVLTRENAVEFLKTVLHHISHHLFVVVANNNNRVGKKADPHEANDDEEDVSGSLQKTFYGFRVMIELIIALRVVGIGAKQVTSSDFDSLMITFWEGSQSFLQRLTHNARASPPMALKHAAMTCLVLMEQLIVGATSASRSVNTTFPTARQHQQRRNQRKRSLFEEVNVATMGCFDRLATDVSLNVDLADIVEKRLLVGEASCRAALCAFRKVTGGHPLETSLRARIVAICVGPLSQVKRARVTYDLEKTLTTLEVDLGQFWFWNFEVALQAAAFQQELSYGCIARLTLNALGSLLLMNEQTEQESVSTERPSIVSVDFLENSPSISLYLPTENHIVASRRILSRIAPALGRIFHIATRPVAAAISDPTRYEAAAEALHQFCSEFLSPLLQGLQRLFYAPLTAKAALQYFARPRQEKMSDDCHPVINATTLAGTSVLLKSSHELTVEDIQSCAAFGVLVHKAIMTLTKLLTQEETGDPARKQQIAEMALTLQTFVVFLIEPFMLGSVTVVDPEHEEMRSSLIHLVQQMGSEILPELFQTARSPDYASCLEACVVVLPSVLLSHMSEGSDSTAVAVCRGLNSVVLGSLWRSICRYAVDECITNLIARLFPLETTGEPGSEDEQNELQSNISGGESDGDSDSATIVPSVSSDDSDDKDDDDDDVRRSNSCSETAGDDTAATTNNDSDDGDDGGHESDDEESKLDPLDGDKLASFLMEDDALADDTATPVTSPFDTAGKNKKRRAQRHQRRQLAHVQHRVFDLVQNALDIRLTHQTQKGKAGDILRLSAFYQHLMWFTRMLEGLVGLSLRLTRGKQRKHPMSSSSLKQDLDTLSQQLCMKISSFLQHQHNKFLSALNVTAQLCHLSTVDEAFDMLNGLRQLGHSVLAQCYRTLSDARIQEIAAGILYAVGRLEEVILVVCSSKVSTPKAVLRRLAKEAETRSIQWDAAEDVTQSQHLSSSCLSCVDIMTSALCHWTKKRRPDISERFFRVFIATASRSGTPPLISLLAVPFGLLAFGTSKIFVVREALAVQADALTLWFTRSQQQVLEGELPCQLTFAPETFRQGLIQKLYQWWSSCASVAVAEPHRTKIRQHEAFSLITSGGTSCNSFQQLLLLQAVYSLIVVNLELADVRAVQHNSGAASTSPTGSLESGVDCCAEQRRVLQKSQRLLFERQAGVSAGRLCKLLGPLVTRMSDDDPQTGPLRALIEKSTQLFKSCLASRRKRRRKQA